MNLQQFLSPTKAQGFVSSDINLQKLQTQLM
jgi:hypothetical protein